MTDLNSIEIMGRITRDLGERDYGFIANGNARASVCIAVNRSKKQGDEWIDEASYFDVTIWGKTAENLKPYLTKGQKITVKGYLKQDRWEKDGEKKSRIAIIAEQVWLDGVRKDDGSNKKAIANGAVNNYSTSVPTNNADMFEGETYDGNDSPF